MKSSTTNLLVDLLGFVVMLGLVVTGVVIRYVLPPGSGHTLELLGLGRHDYGGA